MPDHQPTAPGVVPTPWWVLPTLAVVVEFIFLTALVMAYFGQDKTLLNVMCTAAITQALLPFNYFFGSSKGSQDKDNSMAASAVAKDATIAQQSAALATSSPTAANTTTTATVTEPAKPATAVTPETPAATTTTTITGPTGVAPPPSVPTGGITAPLSPLP